MIVDVFRIIKPKAMGLADHIVRPGIVVVAERQTAGQWRVRYDDMDFSILQADITNGWVERMTADSFDTEDHHQ
jgi:hypothetical protein